MALRTLDFLRKTGPYSIIDDSFPVTKDFNPVRTQPISSAKAKPLSRNSSLYSKKARSKVGLTSAQVTPRTSLNRKPVQEYMSPGIINVTDFVTSTCDKTVTSALRPSPLRQPPKLRQFLHRELLRRRQLSFDENYGKTRLSETGDVKPLAVLLLRQKGMGREREVGSTERRRVKRGLACSSRQRPRAGGSMENSGSGLDRPLTGRRVRAEVRPS